MRLIFQNKGSEQKTKWLVLASVSHALTLILGFGLGVYLLPILTAPNSPDQSILEAHEAAALYTGTFTKDLDGSDLFHWGTGSIFLSEDTLVHQGELAPGPDYQAYLAPTLATNEAEFLAIKDQSVNLGSVKTFGGFMVSINKPVDISQYQAVVIWCEAFGEFITAATLTKPNR